MLSNWEVAAAIANIFEVDCGWETTDDISDEMDDLVPTYKYAELDEVLGGVLAPVDAKLVAVSGDVFGDKLPCTDSLMNAIAERIPAAADPTA